MTSIFVTGGLGDAAVRRAVLGRDVAVLPVVGGVVLPDINGADIERLRHFAASSGAIWQDGPMHTSAGKVDARVEDHLGTTPENIAYAEDIMALMGIAAPDALARRRASLRVGAASRVRARAAALRGQRVGTGEVEVLDRRARHLGFFAMDEVALTYRRFDGQMSGRLTREVFLAGDAVTVLPYDPRRDRVLIIEQMRMGPFGRGDPLPWQLEAIAGRIDPGETPEDCARREAVEEAGLTLGALEKVAEYYPTPGAVTEYLYSYVALCDLPDDAAGVFGVADEAEDIRGHLIRFDQLMDLVTSGEVSNAPLLLTALWLQRERARLRV